MSPQPQNPNQRQAMAQNPQGVMTPTGTMQQGGAQAPMANYRGTAAPPNQLPSNQMPTQGRTPPPWMTRGQGQPAQAGAQPSVMAQTPAQMGQGAAAAPGQMQGRMPAPWMRPQAQGQGMSPATRQQTSGPQAPSSPQTLQNQNKNNTY